MRQALTVALQEYDGAVVLVSHDRHLLRTVADEFRVVHSGKVTPFDGDLEDYARWLAQTDGVSAKAEREVESPDARKQRKRDEAARRNRLSPLKAEVENCERELERLARESAQLSAALAEPGLYAEGASERLRELLEKQTRLGREMEKAEAAWMQASTQLESLAH